MSTLKGWSRIWTFFIYLFCCPNSNTCHSQSWWRRKTVDEIFTRTCCESVAGVCRWLLPSVTAWWACVRVGRRREQRLPLRSSSWRLLLHWPFTWSRIARTWLRLSRTLWPVSSTTDWPIGSFSREVGYVRWNHSSCWRGCVRDTGPWLD